MPTTTTVPSSRAMGPRTPATPSAPCGSMDPRRVAWWRMPTWPMPGRTASANPFHQSLPARLVGVLTARPVLVGLAAGLVIAAVALILSRRQDDHSNGAIAETRVQRILDRVA